MAKKKKAKQDKQNLKKDAGKLIAGAHNDITIPFFNDVFFNQDPTLLARAGGDGLKIYDEIENDTFAYSVLQKRKKTLVAREWEVIAGGQDQIDQDARDFVEEQFKKLPFDRICENLLDATLKGYAVSEIVWQRDDKHIIPKPLIDQEQRRFVFDEYWHPRLLTQQNMYKGIELPSRKFMIHRFGVKGNNPYGRGMGTRLFFPVLFKREGVAFWLKFLEKFASPTIVGKTPYGTLESDQNRLLNILQRFHSDGAITVPVDVDVDLLEATRGGSMSGLEWVNYWDKQMSIAVTGETLTTALGSAGSKAAAQVHMDVLNDLVDSDSDLLSDTLQEQLITWMVDYNYPGAAAPRVVRKRPKNVKAEAETNEVKAKAVLKRNEALRGELSFIANIEEDEVAKTLLQSSGLVDDLDPDVLDALVASREKFKALPANASAAAPVKNDDAGFGQEEAAFAAHRLKKKH